MPALRPLDVVLRRLQQLQDDVLDVLADIPRLGQRGGVGHGERHVEDPRQCLRQQRLAAARRADQHDVGLLQLHVGILRRVVQPLVVVVHRHRQHPLGDLLADHVVVEHLADLVRRRHAVRRLDQIALGLLADDVHAELDALVADEHGRTRDQLADLMLALAAERAIKRVLRVAAARLAHLAPPAFATLSCIKYIVRAEPAATHPNGTCLSRELQAQRARLTPSSRRLHLFGPPGHDLVDMTPVLGLLGRHEAVALQRALHRLKALTGVLDIDLVQPPLDLQRLLGVDHDVGCLPLEARPRAGGP